MVVFYGRAGGLRLRVPAFAIALSGAWASAVGCKGHVGAEQTGGPSTCPAVTPPPAGYQTCRTDADCSNSGMYCFSAPQIGCGDCPPPPQCATDYDCNGGVCMQGQCSTTCQTAADCGGTGNGTCAGGMCTPTPCTDPAVVCPATLSCNPQSSHADAHGCAPASCAMGYPCPPDQSCDAQNVYADAHGCIATLCTKGYTCPAGSSCSPPNALPGGHGCIPDPCGASYACAKDAVCDPSSAFADEHGCAPRPCTQGFACDAFQACGPMNESTHGCGPIACVKDADCPCGGYCVNMTCSPSLWICDYPVE